MDLVEIRKKAKQKKKKNPKATSPEAAPAQLQESADVAAVPEAPTEVVEAPSETELQVDLSPMQVQVEAPDEVAEAAVSRAHDALESLFQEQTDLTLATEESYLQALQGNVSEIDQETNRWLSFALAREEYSVNIEQVREIIKPREITDIPRVPAYLLGVISLRGIVIPVIDLRQRLSLGAVEQDDKARIIVCELEDRIVGLLVDSITQVVNIGEEDIEPTPAILSGLDREMVEGVGRIQGKMIILLDLKQVLDMEMN